MSAIAKLNRGKEHLARLRQVIDEYHASAPFSGVCEEEKETGDLVYRVKIIKPVPSEELGLLVGDLVHNLHSALDLRVSELVVANGNTPTKDHAFPFSRIAQEIQNVAARCLIGVSPAHTQLIIGLSPYQGGNDLLWELHYLDILDKHRQLIIAGSAQQSVIIDTSAMLRKMRPEWNIPEMPIAIRPAERDFPLVDGAELFRVKKAARTEGVEGKVGFPFEIAYSDGNNAYGEALLPKMEAMANEVERVLTQLQ